MSDPQTTSPHSPIRFGRLLLGAEWPVLCRIAMQADGRMALYLAAAVDLPETFQVELLSTGEFLTVRRGEQGAGPVDIAVVERMAA